MSKKLSTDILFQEIEKSGKVDRDKIDFIPKDQILLELYSRIEAMPSSISTIF